MLSPQHRVPKKCSFDYSQKWQCQQEGGVPSGTAGGIQWGCLLFSVPDSKKNSDTDETRFGPSP